MLRKDKLLGGVLGLAVGDALGVPVEFVQREVLKSSLWRVWRVMDLITSL